jgi:hypothetical protein
MRSLKKMLVSSLATGLVLSSGLLCQAQEKEKTFGDDATFLQKQTGAVVLKSADGQAQVAVAPKYQGRVMTSTSGGEKGRSYGWINYSLIESGKFVEHFNAFGGEDRFWMGPEGGQFALFFKKGVPYNMDNWQTPPIMDTESYPVASKTDNEIKFQKTGTVINRSGTAFDVQIDRTVSLLDSKKTGELLGVTIPKSVKQVAYESKNSVTNKGKEAWTKEKGLLSIWILGMFKHSPTTTIVIPFVKGAESELGPKVNDTYFGKVPAERLVVKDDVLFFKGDGKYRSKIGLSPKRARNIAGSYDSANKLLTLVQYDKPAGATDYVNSMWEDQKEPFSGDVINSYNDGPTTTGKPLGPFYELETSSPAGALEPGKALVHSHRTFHFEGPEADLDQIAKSVLGVGLSDIKTALP